MLILVFIHDGEGSLLRVADAPGPNYPCAGKRASIAAVRAPLELSDPFVSMTEWMSAQVATTSA